MIIYSNQIYFEDGTQDGYLEIENRKYLECVVSSGVNSHFPTTFSNIQVSESLNKQVIMMQKSWAFIVKT